MSSLLKKDWTQRFWIWITQRNGWLQIVLSAQVTSLHDKVTALALM